MARRPTALFVNFIKSIVFGGGLLLVLWQLASFLIGSSVFPSPGEVFRFLSGPLFSALSFHLGVSFYRVLTGLALGSLLGIPCGLLLGRHPGLNAFFSPFLYLTYPFPKMVLVPIILILFGVGDSSKILLIAIISFYQMLVSARDSVKTIDRNLIEAFLIFGENGLRLYTKILLPLGLPQIFTCLRLSLSSSIAVLFFAETYATREGIGYYIWDSFARYDYTSVYAASLALCCGAFLLNLTLDSLEKILVRR